MSVQNKSQEPTIQPYRGHLDKLTIDVSFDAVIVPQGRSPERVEKAARLAQQMGATLLSLCSHEAEINKVADFLENMPNGPKSWYAVDFPQGYAIPDVDLGSDQAIPDFARLPSGWDLGPKRNAGLALLKMIDAERALFIDDDMSISQKSASSAGISLYMKDILGFENVGYSDNSVAMHVKAAIEKFGLSMQGLRGRGSKGLGTVHTGMLSGNALAINPKNIDEHFPPIYNEDWFMMYKYIRNGRAAVAPAPSHSYQDEYDPFNPERARREEFGDIVATGLYDALAPHMALDGTRHSMFNIYDPKYWSAFIDQRRVDMFQMLEAIGAEYEDNTHLGELFRKLLNEKTSEAIPAEEQVKYTAILEAGLSISDRVDEDMIVNFLRAWRAAQGRWAAMIEKLPRDKNIKYALSRLALDSYATNE